MATTGPNRRLCFEAFRYVIRNRTWECSTKAARLIDEKGRRLPCWRVRGHGPISQIAASTIGVGRFGCCLGVSFERALIWSASGCR